jgi:hypothetical protein
VAKSWSVNTVASGRETRESGSIAQRSRRLQRGIGVGGQNSIKNTVAPEREVGATRKIDQGRISHAGTTLGHRTLKL